VQDRFVKRLPHHMREGSDDNAVSSTSSAERGD
jgi:hypothetical protein